MGVWEKLELVVYVTLRKCSRACEYFSICLCRWTIGIVTLRKVLDHVYLLLKLVKNWNWLYMSP